MNINRPLILSLLFILLLSCSTEVGNLASTVDLNSSQSSYDEDAGSGTIGESDGLTDKSSGDRAAGPTVYPVLSGTTEKSGETSGALSLRSQDLMINLNNSGTGSYRIEADFEIAGTIPPAGVYLLHIKDSAGNIIGTLRLEVTAAGTVTAVATVIINKPNETITISWPESSEAAFSSSTLYLKGLRIYDLTSGTLAYNSGDLFSTAPKPAVYPVLSGTTTKDSSQSGALDFSKNDLLINLNNPAPGSYKVEADFEITGQVPAAGVYTILIKDSKGNTVGTMELTVNSAGEVSSTVTITVSNPSETLSLAWSEKDSSAFSNSRLYLTGLKITELSSGQSIYDSGSTFKGGIEAVPPFSAAPLITPLLDGTTNRDSSQSGALDLKANDLLIELNNSAAGTFRVELDLKISGEQPAAGNYIITIKDEKGNEVGTLKISVDESGYISTQTEITVTEPGVKLYLSWANENNSNFSKTNIYLKGLRIYDKATNTEGYNSGTTFTSEENIADESAESTKLSFSSTPTISSLLTGTNLADSEQSGAINLKSNDLMISLNNSNTGSLRVEVDFQISGTVPPAGEYTIQIKDSSGNIVGTLTLTVSEAGKVTASTTIELSSTNESLYLTWPEGSNSAFSSSNLHIIGVRLYDSSDNSEIYNSGNTLSTVTAPEEGEDGGEGEYLSLLELFGTTPDFLALSIAGEGYSSSTGSVNLKYYDLVIDVNNTKAGKYKIEVDFKVSGNIDKNETYKIEVMDSQGNNIGFIILKIRKQGTIMAHGHVTLSQPNERIIFSWESAHKKKVSYDLADLEVTGVRFYAKKSELD